MKQDLCRLISPLGLIPIGETRSFVDLLEEKLCFRPSGRKLCLLEEKVPLLEEKVPLLEEMTLVILEEKVPLLEEMTLVILEENFVISPLGPILRTNHYQIVTVRIIAF